MIRYVDYIADFNVLNRVYRTYGVFKRDFFGFVKLSIVGTRVGVDVKYVTDVRALVFVDLGRVR